MSDTKFANTKQGRAKTASRATRRSPQSAIAAVRDRRSRRSPPSVIATVRDRQLRLPHVEGAASMQSSRIGAPQGGTRQSTRPVATRPVATHSVATHTVAARRASLGPRIAFTLLELLIAIAIIGVLAGLILQVASSA